MSTFDMSILDGEPLEFKNLYGKDYTIPADIPVEFSMKLYNLYQKTNEIKEEGKQIEIMLQFVSEILNLDPVNKITPDEIKEKFSTKAMVIIINEAMKHLKNIEQNPNLGSPSSK
ncbi:MAG: hypothetical protein ABF651_00120 [Sporolactobacillus sp.]